MSVVTMSVVTMSVVTMSVVTMSVVTMSVVTVSVITADGASTVSAGELAGSVDGSGTGPLFLLADEPGGEGSDLPDSRAPGPSGSDSSGGADSRPPLVVSAAPAVACR
jgi:hypothetical protein